MGLWNLKSTLELASSPFEVQLMEMAVMNQEDEVPTAAAMHILVVRISIDFQIQKFNTQKERKDNILNRIVTQDTNTVEIRHFIVSDSRRASETPI
ncbi:hypothetical protein Tco_0121223 [Tanacetum coccineum]